MSESLIFVGMDVHQDSVTLAVFEGASKEPAIVQRLPNDLRTLRRFFDRWAKRGEIRTCYEASGAGYVLYHELTEWGHACEIIAPSLTPIRPGEQRKHDRHDAIQLARLYRAGELVPIRIPSPSEERVELPPTLSRGRRRAAKSDGDLRTSGRSWPTAVCHGIVFLIG